MTMQFLLLITMFKCANKIKYKNNQSELWVLAVSAANICILKKM